MSRTDPVIRLVGGPRPLDGATYDLSCSDARPGRRRRRPASCGPCAGRRSCRSPPSASGARTGRRPRSWPSEWTCAVFAYGRDRRVRMRYFRYQATHRLAPGRDEHGRWSLVIAETTATPAATPAAPPISAAMSAAAPADQSLQGPHRPVWVVLEDAVDEAAARFADGRRAAPRRAARRTGRVDPPSGRELRRRRGATVRRRRPRWRPTGSPARRPDPDGPRAGPAARGAGGGADRHDRRGDHPPRRPAPRDRRRRRPGRAPGPPANRVDGAESVGVAYHYERHRLRYQDNGQPSGRHRRGAVAPGWDASYAANTGPPPRLRRLLPRDHAALPDRPGARPRMRFRRLHPGDRRPGARRRGRRPRPAAQPAGRGPCLRRAEPVVRRGAGAAA